MGDSEAPGRPLPAFLLLILGLVLLSPWWELPDRARPGPEEWSPAWIAEWEALVAAEERAPGSGEDQARRLVLAMAEEEIGDSPVGPLPAWPGDVSMEVHLGGAFDFGLWGSWFTVPGGLKGEEAVLAEYTSSRDRGESFRLDVALLPPAVLRALRQSVRALCALREDQFRRRWTGSGECEAWRGLRIAAGAAVLEEHEEVDTRRSARAFRIAGLAGDVVRNAFEGARRVPRIPGEEDRARMARFLDRSLRNLEEADRGTWMGVYARVFLALDDPVHRAQAAAAGDRAERGPGEALRRSPGK